MDSAHTLKETKEYTASNEKMQLIRKPAFKRTIKKLRNKIKKN